MLYAALGAAAAFAVLAFLAWRRSSNLAEQLRKARAELRARDHRQAELQHDRDFFARAVELSLEGRFTPAMLEERRLFEDLDGPTARALAEKDADLVLLDVRTAPEHASGHLPGSLWIPVDELEERLAELPKERAFLVYCAMGSRSAMAADLLTRSGFRRVYNLEAGYGSWPRG